MHIYNIKPYNFKFYSKDRLPLKDLAMAYKYSGVVINKYCLKTISKYNDTFVISWNEGMTVNICTNNEYTTLQCSKFYEMSLVDIFICFIGAELFDVCILKKDNFFYCFSREEIDTYSVNIYRALKNKNEVSQEDCDEKVDYEGVFSDPSALLGEYKEITSIFEEVVFEIDYLNDFNNVKNLIENTKERNNLPEDIGFCGKIKDFFVVKGPHKIGYIRFGYREEDRLNYVKTLINFNIKDKDSSVDIIYKLIESLLLSAADFIEIETDIEEKHRTYIYIIKNKISVSFYLSTSVYRDSTSNIKIYEDFNLLLNERLSN